MSFDLFFQDLTDGRKENPALSPEHAEALQRVVSKYGGPPVPDESGYFFDSERAGSIELYAAGKNSGGMLALRGWSEGKADFVFDLIAQTGWSVIVGGDPMLTLATHELTDVERETLDGIDLDFRRVESGAEVFKAVETAFGGWADYRDQVVKG